MYVVLVYDIAQDKNGQKRWSHVYKICTTLQLYK